MEAHKALFEQKCAICIDNNKIKGNNCDFFFEKNVKNLLRKNLKCVIIFDVVTLIAVKREVALQMQRFSVERMSSLETGDKSLYNRTLRNAKDVSGLMCQGYTWVSVQSPLVVLKLSAKRRRLFLWQQVK